MYFELSFGRKKKEERSINDPLNYQAQNPEHPSSNPNRWLLDLFNSRPTSSGVRVDPETAPAFSAVYRCVSLISSTMALLPQYVYKQDETGRTMAMDHYVARLLKEPSELFTSYVWKENMMQFALLWGNGYSRIIRDDYFNASSFQLLHSKNVRPFIALKNDGNEGLFYEVTYELPKGGSKKEIIPSMDMFHIPCISHDGIAGKSPITVAREGIGLAFAAEKFNGDFYKNDAAYSGIYTHPGELNNEAYKRLKESLSDHSMYGEKNRTLLLEAGTDYKPVTMPMRDAQFIESRKFQIEEISRLYGVPLHKISSMGAATNNNIEQQALEFISDTMLSWATKWEVESDRKLFTEMDKAKYCTHHDFREITRGDSAQRSSYATKMFMIGAMNRNEIRAIDDLPPVENGDKFYIPLNMQDAEKEIEEPTETKSLPGEPGQNAGGENGQGNQDSTD